MSSSCSVVFKPIALCQDQSESCQICQEEIDSSAVDAIGHKWTEKMYDEGTGKSVFKKVHEVFHKACAVGWFAEGNTECPSCRCEVSNAESDYSVGHSLLEAAARAGNNQRVSAILKTAYSEEKKLYRDLDISYAFQAALAAGQFQTADILLEEIKSPAAESSLNWIFVHSYVNNYHRGTWWAIERGKLNLGCRSRAIYHYISNCEKVERSERLKLLQALLDNGPITQKYYGLAMRDAADDPECLEILKSARVVI